VVDGFDDRDVDGVVDPGERRPDLRGRADFIGLNYYFRSRVTGLAAPASTTVPLFDFLPTNTYAHPRNPTAPPCPTPCTEFGWEIYPEGFRLVLEIAGGHEKPIYVTETALPTQTMTCARPTWSTTCAGCAPQCGPAKPT
jgi:beta-galactosidase